MSPESRPVRDDDHPGAAAGAEAVPAAGTAPRRNASAALRSVLRLPTAVALLAIGVIHLPAGFAGLRAGEYMDGVAVVTAVVCLVTAALLTVQDTVWTWAAAATAAVGVIVVHAVASTVSGVHLLRNSVGDGSGWSATAVVCAALAAGCAGTVLVRGRARRPAAEDTGPAEDARPAEDA
ncbi:hypothetical protein OG552_02405 [Streptomyces sp. NBC_01476]|uniref:hypothetical protein n=1 Tax=Streptomyces sp. NBC_01476 TaxID=2903881 RepID=UPI002E357A48|nr:hypothetical protein [Streptomyces sp. NBC_01476]